MNKLPCLTDGDKQIGSVVELLLGILPVFAKAVMSKLPCLTDHAQYFRFGSRTTAQYSTRVLKAVMNKLPCLTEEDTQSIGSVVELLLSILPVF